MLSNIEIYRRLLDELDSIQVSNKGKESPEEDNLLDEMDAVWARLTLEEQKSV